MFAAESRTPSPSVDVDAFFRPLTPAGIITDNNINADVLHANNAEEDGVSRLKFFNLDALTTVDYGINKDNITTHQVWEWRAPNLKVMPEEEKKREISQEDKEQTAIFFHGYREMLKKQAKYWVQNKWTKHCRDEHRLKRDDGQLVQTYEEAAVAAKRLNQLGNNKKIFQIKYERCFTFHWEFTMAIDYMKVNKIRYRKWKCKGTGPKGFIERILVHRLKLLRQGFRGIVRRSAAEIVDGKKQDKPTKENIEFDPHLHCVVASSPSTKRRLSL